jgi:integral membrane sensor domain MASE1
MLNNEQRQLIANGLLIAASVLLGILTLAWVCSSISCWMLYGGRLIPCAIEVWWKGR